MDKRVITPKLAFKMSRLLQTELGAWRDCRHESCVETNLCQGGPRGTCAKTGGWPICTNEGNERFKIAKSAKIWPGEKADKTETISERKWRRFDEMMKRLTIEARLENTGNEQTNTKSPPSSSPPW